MSSSRVRSVSPLRIRTRVSRSSASGTVTCSLPWSYAQAASSSSRVGHGSFGQSSTTCAISPARPTKAAMSSRPTLRDIMGCTVAYASLRPDPRWSPVASSLASRAGTVTSTSVPPIGSVEETSVAESLRRT